MNGPVLLQNGETFTYYGGMDVTVEKADTYQRENFGEIYTFTAFKLKYENKSSNKIVTLTDFEIQDEKGKTVDFKESIPNDR